MVGGFRPQSQTGLIEETQYVAYIGNKGYENGNNIILVKHGIVDILDHLRFGIVHSPL